MFRGRRGWHGGAGPLEEVVNKRFAFFSRRRRRAFRVIAPIVINYTLCDLPHLWACALIVEHALRYSRLAFRMVGDAARRLVGAHLRSWRSIRLAQYLLRVGHVVRLLPRRHSATLLGRLVHAVFD